MSTDERLRQEQRGKLKRLIEPLREALLVEPGDTGDDFQEAECWEQANGLYESLTELFREEQEP